MPLTCINVKIFEAKSGKFLTSQKLAYENKQISNSFIQMYSSRDHTDLNIETKDYFLPLEEEDVVLNNTTNIPNNSIITKNNLNNEVYMTPLPMDTSNLLSQRTSPPPLPTYPLPCKKLRVLITNNLSNKSPNKSKHIPQYTDKPNVNHNIN